ncbi:uncharacterized protein [Coffea arabica]|uniref:MULE transposase domain-containing protein n=1 Tax=Coffea arabica TaxID=13443 RepID=A0ABM4WP72_COFAR
MAKQKAIVELLGDWVESYKLLPRYMEILKMKNPGIVVHWDKDTTYTSPSREIFNGVFWAFEGFKHCHPVISIDGTFLYGKYKGAILIAVSVDANNQLFPLAFSIMDSENNDSWGWFMACIREFVTQRRGLCVISDHHPGIITTMSQIGSKWIEPFAYHCFCIRHLASNFNTKFHDKILKHLLVAAANENQVFKFQRKMETIGKINPKARKWLDDLPVEKWALAHDGGKRYGIMTTNLSEVFTSVLKDNSFGATYFYCVNSYFAIRRQLAVQRSVCGQSFTPFVDGKSLFLWDQGRRS